MTELVSETLFVLNTSCNANYALTITLKYLIFITLSKGLFEACLFHDADNFEDCTALMIVKRMDMENW
jgi:hypothetical protein